MNVLIIGSGGRESALLWAIRQSPQCNKLFIAPGNGGTSEYNVAELNINNFAEVKSFCIESDVHFIVVGPEDPLSKGIYDFFDGTGIVVFGPSKLAAQLEGSKSFAKAFMQKHHIPTAQATLITKDNLQDGLDYIDRVRPPYVLKADGLAAGKGVIIEQDAEKAKIALRHMLDGQFGKASESVLIEDYLDGIEFSAFVLTDGDSYRILPLAKDYKRAGKGDTGLNTGGMGAISPVPFVSDELKLQLEEQIVKPTIHGIQTENMTYRGVLFIGLMLSSDKLYVIEYNCRFGDPETQVVIPRVSGDILDILYKTSTGKVSEIAFTETSSTAATVILCSPGYPEAYPKGLPIQLAHQVGETMLFHAGTKRSDNRLLSAGGRVLSVTALKEDSKQALAACYDALSEIQMEGKYYREDIGFDIH